MTYLPEGYKNRKHRIKHWGVASTGQVAPQGEVEQWEHWDGRTDAVVKPRTIGMRLVKDAPPNPQLVAAVAELEAATREFKWAKASGDPEWAKKAKTRFQAAKARVKEHQ